MMSLRVMFWFIQDFHEEHALQAFRRRDKGDTGYINAKDFEEIMCKLKSYLLTPFVKENLVTVSYPQLCTVESSLFLVTLIPTKE